MMKRWGDGEMKREARTVFHDRRTILASRNPEGPDPARDELQRLHAELRLFMKTFQIGAGLPPEPTTAEMKAALREYDLYALLFDKRGERFIPTLRAVGLWPRKGGG